MYLRSEVFLGWQRRTINRATNWTLERPSVFDSRVTAIGDIPDVGRFDLSLDVGSMSSTTGSS